MVPEPKERFVSLALCQEVMDEGTSTAVKVEGKCGGTWGWTTLAYFSILQPYRSTCPSFASQRNEVASYNQVGPALRNCKVDSWLQRIGWILQLLGIDHRQPPMQNATFLSIYVDAALRVVSLTSSRFRVAISHSCYWHHGCQRCARWRIQHLWRQRQCPLTFFCATRASWMTWSRKDMEGPEGMGIYRMKPGLTFLTSLRKKSLHNGWRKLKRSSLKSRGSQDMPRPGKGKAWKLCLLVGSQQLGLCHIVPCTWYWLCFPSFSQRCSSWCLRNLASIGSRPFCHGSRGYCFCTCGCRGKSVWKEGCWDAWGKALQPWVKLMMHHQWDKRNKRETTWNKHIH